jgi:hypothetical protein
MARAKALMGRIKQEYRRQNMVLLNGLEFNKRTWTQIPRGKEDRAKQDYAEILDFEDGVVNQAEQQALLEEDMQRGVPGQRVGADVQNSVWQEEIPSSQVDSALQTNLDRGAEETSSGKSTAGKVRKPKTT